MCVHALYAELSILIVNICLSSPGRVTVPEPSTVQCRPQKEKETGVYTVMAHGLVFVGVCIC